MKRAFSTLFILSALLLSACSDESPYSGYRVNFSFDSTIHPYNQARSHGLFICVRTGNNIGQYRLTDANGQTTTVNIPQIQIQQNIFHFGLGGLIIGTPTACDNTIWAYEWACPKCDLARYRLDIDYTLGHASCKKCGTKFDLNSGGIAIDGNSRPMWHYRVLDTGSEVIIQN